MHPAPMPVLTIDRIDVGRLRRHATKIAAIRSVVGRACEPLERSEAAQQHGRSNANHKREQSDDETKKKASGWCIHVVLPLLKALMLACS